MAKVELSPEFSKISGRLCKKDKSCIGYNTQTGKVYRYDYHERDDKNTAKQKLVRNKFTQKARAAAKWWGDNKELVDETTGAVTREASEAMGKLMAAYKSQRKYGNPYNYLRSLITDDLKLTIGGTTVTVSVPIDLGEV